MRKRILLFIPMYNCEKQIVRVLDQLDDSVMDYISQILIVNNRSTDNGENAVIAYAKAHPKLPVKLLRNKENYGGGGSHKIAFNYAKENKFDYIIVLHGDDQGSIKDLIPYLKTGEAYKYDAFLGSRFSKGSQLVNYSKFRIFGNHIFNFFMTLALGRKISDLGAGLNMYRVSFLENGFYMYFINSLTFYVYMLIYTVYSGAGFKFFPLSWREDDQISNAKFFRQSKEIFKITLGYLFNKKGTFSRKENEYSVIDYRSEVIYEQ
jgi:glycosyltransferase involved in cell wall biosynthesis